MLHRAYAALPLHLVNPVLRSQREEGNPSCFFSA
jgi:hypothetical protein